MSPATESPAEISHQMERVLYEVKRVVVGQDHFLERVMVALLAELRTTRSSRADQEPASD